MDMPMDYRVGCYAETLSNTVHMPKLTNIMLNRMTVLSTIRYNLLQEFIHNAIVSFLRQISIVGCCNW